MMGYQHYQHMRNIPTKFTEIFKGLCQQYHVRRLHKIFITTKIIKEIILMSYAL